jgi:molybdate transport system substrate-binding protein
MQQVASSGSVEGRPTVFARNRLAIAVPADNPGRVEALRDLARPGLVVALCAPDVPCGAAAASALHAAGVRASVDTYEDDVKAALTRVRLGEVDAALVYRTDVRAAGSDVRGIDFPQAAAATTDYLIARLTGAPNPSGAAAFVALVQSRAGQAALARAGFERP